MKTIGMICYATEQGLGYLAKSFFDAGVTTKALLFDHPNGRPTRTDWYPEGTPVVRKRPFLTHERRTLLEFLSGIDVLLCFETPFDWQLLPTCRAKGIRTVLVPMHEWYLEHPPFQFDAFVNPSRLDRDIFGGPFLPVPTPGIEWQRRSTALRFLHNAGHIGSRCHKGTLEVLRAMRYVGSPIELTVRCQSQEIHRLIERECRSVLSDPRIRLEVREDVPREKLFEVHDVYVAPEKYNGLSLPLQEAFCAGMAVLTTDRYPTNTWLPESDPGSGARLLTPTSGTNRVRAWPGHLIVDESVVSPEDVAKAIDGIYGRSIERTSDLGLEYSRSTSWDAVRDQWIAAIEGDDR